MEAVVTDKYRKELDLTLLKQMCKSIAKKKAQIWHLWV